MLTSALDPAEFPALHNISAAFMQRLVLVPTVRPRRREYVHVPVRTGDHEHRGSAVGFFAQWGMNWESGAYRVSYFDPDELRRYVPERLAARLEKEQEGFELHLVPSDPGGRNYAYDSLYHLLPLRTLRKFRLPVRERGAWPSFPDFRPNGSASETARLRTAFAHHVWPLLSPKSKLRSFSTTDSLKLLAHDLDFWFPHLDRVIEDRLRCLDRCANDKDDYQHETIEADRARIQPALPPGVEIQRPRKGCELWFGEEAAWEVTQDLVEEADAAGNLRAIIDVIRSGREHDDFSAHWSPAKEDFERKLYRKRSRVRVSFVELHDTTAVHGPDAQVVDSLLWKSLLALVEPRERRVVVCLRSGITQVGDIAAELGYKNHSPVSKALARIRSVVERLIPD